MKMRNKMQSVLLLLGAAPHAVHGFRSLSRCLYGSCGALSTTSTVSHKRRRPTAAQARQQFTAEEVPTNKQAQGAQFWNTVIVEKSGPEAITTELVEAMRLQWTYGFPCVPSGMRQLTHGFHYYPASMQAAAAQHLLNTVLPGDDIIDPFMGGGTVAIEGLRAGRRRIVGCDVSPLATFVSTGRTWLPPPGGTQAIITAVNAIEAAVTGSTPPPVHQPRLNAEASARATHAGIAARDAILALTKDLHGGRASSNENHIKSNLVVNEREETSTFETLREVSSINTVNEDRQITDDLREEDLKVEPKVSTVRLSSWNPVKRCVIAAVEAAPLLAHPLNFIYSTALQGAAKSRHNGGRKLMPIDFFVNTARKYAAAIEELSVTALKSANRDEWLLHEETGSVVSPIDLALQDAREFTLNGKDQLGALLTSPPYPGVYDYLSYSREIRAKVGGRFTDDKGDNIKPTDTGGTDVDNMSAGDVFMKTGTPSGRNWPSEWKTGEFGAFKSFKKDPFNFKSVWQRDHHAWITNIAKCLKPGARAAIMIGDGAGVNALTSTLAAALDGKSSLNGEADGNSQSNEKLYKLLGHCTLRSVPDTRWMMRTEHLILLEKL